MPDEDTQQIMNDYDLDEEDAERVKEIMVEYDVDEEDAVEIDEAL